MSFIWVGRSTRGGEAKQVKTKPSCLHANFNPSLKWRDILSYIREWHLAFPVVLAHTHTHNIQSHTVTPIHTLNTYSHTQLHTHNITHTVKHTHARIYTSTGHRKADVADALWVKWLIYFPFTTISYRLDLDVLFLWIVSFNNSSQKRTPFYSNSLRVYLWVHFLMRLLVSPCMI